jgi:hypothetical protein
MAISYFRVSAQRLAIGIDAFRVGELELLGRTGKFVKSHQPVSSGALHVPKRQRPVAAQPAALPRRRIARHLALDVRFVSAVDKQRLICSFAE